MNEQQAYMSGYSDAIVKLEELIDLSIRRNGGAVTSNQVIKVFNDILVHLYREKNNINDVYDFMDSEEENVDSVVSVEVDLSISLKELEDASGIKITNLTGGMN